MIKLRMMHIYKINILNAGALKKLAHTFAQHQ